MKTPKASGALRWAPDPTPRYAHFVCPTPLHYIGKIGQTRAGAPLWPNPGSATVSIATSIYFCTNLCNCYVTFKAIISILKHIPDSNRRVFFSITRGIPLLGTEISGAQNPRASSITQVSVSPGGSLRGRLTYSCSRVKLQLNCCSPPQLQLYSLPQLPTPTLGRQTLGTWTVSVAHHLNYNF